MSFIVICFTRNDADNCALIFTRHAVQNAAHFKPLDLDKYAKQLKSDGKDSLSIELQELKIRFFFP